MVAEHKKHLALDFILIGLVMALWHGWLWTVYPPHLGGDATLHSVYTFDLLENGDKPTAYTALFYWMPLAPLAQTLPFHWGGLRGYQVFFTGLAILAAWLFYLTLRPWGRRWALAGVALFAAYLPIQVSYHQINVASVFATTLLGAVYALRRALLQPTFAAWGWLGVALGLVVLTRANGLVLLFFGVAVLWTDGNWRQKVGRLAWMLALLTLTLAPWTAYKGLRYGEWSLSRNGWLSFYGLYSNTALTEALILPENGPASQELAALVEEHLLPHPYYAAYNVQLEQIFGYEAGRRDVRFLNDMVVLVDQQKGWHSDHALLRQVVQEALRRHALRYGRIILQAWCDLMFTRYSLDPAPRPVASLPILSADFDPANPPPLSENEYIARFIYPMMSSRPAHLPPLPLAELFARLDANHRRIAPFFLARGDEAKAEQLARAWANFPPPALIYTWGLLAILGGRGKMRLFALLGLAGALILSTGNVFVTDYARYRLPLDPLFLLGFCLGVRVLWGRLSRGKTQFEVSPVLA